MRKRYIKLIFLMVCMLIFVGCQSGKNPNAAENTDGNESVEEDVENNETVSEEGYQYSDILLDRTKIDGKMAVFFLRGDYAVEDENGNEEATGEATLLVAPDGTTMLVDFNDGMINGAYIAKVLQELGIQKLDYVVLTSPHVEHLGGYSIVLHCVEVGQVITNHHEFTSNIIYNKFKKDIEEKNIQTSTVYEGDSFSFGKDVQVEVFNPAKEYAEWGKDAGQRDGALLLKFTYNQSNFLIGGDIGGAVEEQLIAKYGDKLQSDVVKMNDQGSKEANSKDWIATVNAKIAVGERNLVENDLVLGRYAMRVQATLHTAIDGTCLVYTAGDGTYEVQVEKERIGGTYLDLNAQEGHLTVQ